MHNRNNSQHTTQGIILAGWAAVALAMANIADGISVDPYALVLFSTGMALIGHRIKTFCALSIFSITTVVTAVLVSSYQGIAVSAEQFFGTYFGIADVLVLALMWIGPLVAAVARNTDNRISEALLLAFTKSFKVASFELKTPRITIPAFAINSNEVWTDQFFYQIDFRRGPPIKSI